ASRVFEASVDPSALGETGDTTQSAGFSSLDIRSFRPLMRPTRSQLELQFVNFCLPQSLVQIAQSREVSLLQKGNTRQGRLRPEDAEIPKTEIKKRVVAAPAASVSLPSSTSLNRWAQ
ncbi:MAG: hypothetical protein WA496_08930, partial [Candidatus Udaeobacter sp.]